MVDEQVRYASGNYDVFYAKRPKTHTSRRNGLTFKEAQTQMMMMMMAAPSVSTTMYSVDYEGGDPTLKEPMV